MVPFQVLCFFSFSISTTLSVASLNLNELQKLPTASQHCPLLLSIFYFHFYFLKCSHRPPRPTIFRETPSQIIVQFLYGAREEAGKVAKQAESKVSKARQTKQGKEARKQREVNKKEVKESGGRTDGRKDGRTNRRERTLRFARYTGGRQSFTQSGRAEGNHLLRKGGKGRAENGRTDGKEGRKGGRKEASKGRKEGRKLGKAPYKNSNIIWEGFLQIFLGFGGVWEHFRKWKWK